MKTKSSSFSRDVYNHLMHIFELFYRNQGPHPGGGWQLWAEQENSWNAALLPHQQPIRRRSVPPSAQMLPLKILPWKSFQESAGSFEHKLPILLAGLRNKSSSAPSSEVLVCLASLCTGHMALGVTTLTVQGGYPSHVCPSFLFWSKYLEIRFALNSFQEYNDYGNELWTLNSEELFLWVVGKSNYFFSDME